ncbi:hypothetical protein OKW21_002236 [Catalinimonas alkaloidigena]|nr:hypothetical protein [Catalinimonas alkaloidigena]
MKNKIDIYTHHYFPFHMIVLGLAFLLMSVIISMMYPVVAIVLFMLGILLVSTHYRLSVDTENKKYREYLWITGFKKGEKLPYKQIIDIHIKHITQSIEYGFVSRVRGRKKVYSAAIEIDGNQSLFVGEHRSEKKLLSKVNKIAEAVQTEVYKSYE